MEWLWVLPWEGRKTLSDRLLIRSTQFQESKRRQLQSGSEVHGRTRGEAAYLGESCRDCTRIRLITECRIITPSCHLGRVDDVTLSPSASLRINSAGDSHRYSPAPASGAGVRPVHTCPPTPLRCGDNNGGRCQGVSLPAKRVVHTVPVFLWENDIIILVFVTPGKTTLVFTPSCIDIIGRIIKVTTDKITQR